MLMSISRILQKAGFAVEGAANGQLAIDKIKGGYKPALILTDLNMPVLVVAGARDEAYAERAHRLASCIGSNAQLAIIDGAGHACHLERPDAAWAAVRPFLAGR